MQGEQNDNFLNNMDKKIGAAIKERAWAEVEDLIAEIRRQAGKSANSSSDKNWQRDPGLELAAPPSLEAKLARAIADGFQCQGFLAELPVALGLLGLNKGRRIDLLKIDGDELCFFDLKVTASAEDIRKALGRLIVHSLFYQLFLEDPKKFGYGTQRSPLLLSQPKLCWELLAPLDMLNPRRSDMRWGEKDVGGMQGIMRSLGVQSFSLSRLQADAEALRNSINKDNFSANKARQWFENRTAVLIA